MIRFCRDPMTEAMMAAKEIIVKKYVVRLSDREREQLRRRRTITESICRRDGSGVVAGDSCLAARRVLQVNGRREFDSVALRSLASPP
jgi:hypothetical protein